MKSCEASTGPESDWNVNTDAVGGAPERDVAARFQTGRGTVREAYKKLEQLGIASIQPGGARVVSVRECTLDVLGPLLELGENPDPRLVDQVMEIGGVLISYAAEAAVERGDESQLARVKAVLDEVLNSEDDDLRGLQAPRRLARLFAEASNQLVLLLIINGLRNQFEPRRTVGGLPGQLEAATLKRIARQLDEALERRDSTLAGQLMKELLGLIRTVVNETLSSQRHEPTALLA